MDLRVLARRTALSRERLLRGLAFLEEHQVLDWLAPTTGLRVWLLEPRAGRLHVDHDGVRRARAQAEARLADMLRYSRSVTCRRHFLLTYFGEQRICWGTDCLWYGSPQDQIQAMRSFQISPEFQERYGYLPADPTSWLGEVSINGRRDIWTYGAALSSSQDVPFPYLRMDERENLLWSAYVARDGHKLYVNRTHHVMNNTLRASSKKMFMETDATNFTAGLTGTGYELFYRAWDAWNQMGMVGSNEPPRDQHMIPDLRIASASYARELHRGGFNFGLRLGLQRTWITDDERLGFFRTFYPDAPEDRWFVPFSAGVSYARALPGDLVVGLQGEVASTPPAAEYLYVSVRRMGDKPWWTGNPELDAPVKAMLRGTVGAGAANVEAFFTHVARYPYLKRTAGDTQRAVSFGNVDARMIGFTVHTHRRFVDLTASYTFAQNLSNDGPLAEIAPLSGGATVRSPRFWGIQAATTIEASLAQDRVDDLLDERRTPAWLRVDAGLSRSFGDLAVVFEIENLADNLYYRHLSYLRDPFASGMRVFEPGRQVRLSVQHRL